MSSTVRWGGIAGVVAAALLVLSAILNQLSPIKTTYDSTASYLYLAAVFVAYVAVLVALLGIHAVHRGRPRYGRLGAVGTVLDLRRLRDHRHRHGDQHGAGTAISPDRSDWRRTAIARWLCTSRCDLLRAKLLPWWCGVLLIVAFPLGDSCERDLQFRRESAAGVALGFRGDCAAGTT